ncbi:uncharacterized protein LOC131146891 [Malania oleifera]|uniref:uncharacterized protein LOC131146891 n=1 Tax=Malania oleifera TaxID=397392 RepID=UPI0025AE26B9|nr:uncharacterized protein LOC131146891 [Malania oleifera]
MQSPCLREALQAIACPPGCCPSPLLGFPEPHEANSKSSNTSAACRKIFVRKTSSFFFSETQFTNHESLPSLEESFAQFTKAYPLYSETQRIDQIRAQEYQHLSLTNHVCLDYIGIGLFSQAQFRNLNTRPSFASSSSPTPPTPPPRKLDFPFFSLSCKTVNLKFQLLHGVRESEMESAIKKKIMGFLNISENDYCMVFTANRTSAFKLVAESYPFKSSRKLLTVYDYESEAVGAMIDSSEKRGAQVMSAEFTWPSLRIQSAKLKKMIVSKKKKKKKRGLFVFPLHSRLTGTRYSYQWMRLAQENRWHVLLDACALGPKDMDSFALSLFCPDFLICSFYNVFGENPSGFGCLFVKKSTVLILESSTGIGIVSLVPAKKLSLSSEESSETDAEPEQTIKFGSKENDSATSSPFSGTVTKTNSERYEQVETTKLHKAAISPKQRRPITSDIVESEQNTKSSASGSLEIEFRGLDHVDSMGLIKISNRARCLINWVVNAMMKLQHPSSGKENPLVKIYGPKVKFDRGPALAFNVFDWKGEKVDPALVQKLADRNNISLGYGFLHHIWFAEEYEEEKEKVIERRTRQEIMQKKRTDKADLGITVVTAAIGFLANFEDIYKLWAFVAQFLDADFVEKERWRYTALNQRTIEV